MSLVILVNQRSSILCFLTTVCLLVKFQYVEEWYLMR
jgi:hypothetical protein